MFYIIIVVLSVKNRSKINLLLWYMADKKKLSNNSKYFVKIIQFVLFLYFTFDLLLPNVDIIINRFEFQYIILH